MQLKAAKSGREKNVFLSYMQPILIKFIIKLLRKEYALIVKPRYSFQFAKTIKLLKEILDVRTCQNEMKFTELFLSALFVTVQLSAVREIEVQNFQAALSQFVYSLFRFLRQIVKDELALLIGRTDV